MRELRQHKKKTEKQWELLQMRNTHTCGSSFFAVSPGVLQG